MSFKVTEIDTKVNGSPYATSIGISFNERRLMCCCNCFSHSLMLLTQKQPKTKPRRLRRCNNKCEFVRDTEDEVLLFLIDDAGEIGIHRLTFSTCIGLSCFLG